jgi:hypothetical protein
MAECAGQEKERALAGEGATGGDGGEKHTLTLFTLDNLLGSQGNAKYKAAAKANV